MLDTGIPQFRDEDVTITVSRPAIPNAELTMRIVHIPSGVMVEGRGQSQRKLMNSLLPTLRRQWEDLQRERMPSIELPRPAILAFREVYGMLKTEVEREQAMSGDWVLPVTRVEEISEKANALATQLSRLVHIAKEIIK